VAAPAVEARLGHPKLLVAKLFIESTTAQVMTIPIILYIFGDLSIVAPFTNLIVLPMVPLAMLVSFVAGLAGMIVPAFAGWLAWPAGVLLWLMLAIVDWFGRLPWAGTTVYIDATTMLVTYGLIVLLVLMLKRVNQRAGRTENDSTIEAAAQGLPARKKPPTGQVVGSG
jgi:competence protein ComEC